MGRCCGRLPRTSSSAAASVALVASMLLSLLVRIDGGPAQPLTNRLGEFVVALDRPDAGAPGGARGCSVLD